MTQKQRIRALERQRGEGEPVTIRVYWDWEEVPEEPGARVIRLRWPEDEGGDNDTKGAG